MREFLGGARPGVNGVRLQSLGWRVLTILALLFAMNAGMMYGSTQQLLANQYAMLTALSGFNESLARWSDAISALNRSVHEIQEEQQQLQKRDDELQRKLTVVSSFLEEFRRGINTRTPRHHR